jgi:phosphate/sulfate permease
MAALLFISGGLFLGWILGAKNMSTIFGTAVATKMVKFRVAALVAGIFVVSGVILQGSGGATTIANLGSVDALGGAFTIALCTGMTILALGYYGMPSSITQAIVGAILGWCFFTKTGIEYNHLTTIITCWVTGPLAGFVLAPLLFLLLRFYLRKSRLHILKLDFYLRTALLVAGAFASYSLGANNIGNVAGVFVSAIPELSMNVGSLPVNGIHLLLFLCGIAVAAGIASYGKKRIEAKGNGIKELTPEAAIIVVFTQGLILFVFSSQQLLNISLLRTSFTAASSTLHLTGSSGFYFRNQFAKRSWRGQI